MKRNNEEPLIRGEFQEFRENEFRHLDRRVWRIEGELKVLIPLAVAILGIVVAILLR